MNQSRNETEICKIPHKIFDESRNTSPVFFPWF